MSAWTLHHIVAMCQGCEWMREHHGVGASDEVLNAARCHWRKTGHYVQVERGQHMHYGLTAVPSGEAARGQA